MAIRKTVVDEFVVNGERRGWLSKCRDALRSGGFTSVESNEAFGQVKGDYKKFTVYGSIEISLLPEGENTKVIAKATANIDNIFALFSSPGKKILVAFKSNLKRPHHL